MTPPRVGDSLRLHFQAIPVDVYAAVAYSILVSAILLATGSGNPLALVLVLFVPGYLATVAILPRKEEADWTLRIALSFGLSLAIVAFTGIALNYSPWGINPWTIIASLLVLTAILGPVAYRRRMLVRPSERLEGSIDLNDLSKLGGLGVPAIAIPDQGKKGKKE